MSAHPRLRKPLESAIVARSRAPNVQNSRIAAQRTGPGTLPALSRTFRGLEFAHRGGNLAHEIAPVLLRCPSREIDSQRENFLPAAVYTAGREPAMDTVPESSQLFFRRSSIPIYWLPKLHSLSGAEAMDRGLSRVAAVCGPLAVGAAVVASWFLFAGSSDRGPEGRRAALVEALRGERRVEGRLSWDLPHSPFDPARPGAPSRDDDRRRAERAIERAAGRNGASPRELADRGVVFLLRGQVDHAVRDLEQAAERDPEDARILSDLAVAYIVRARRRDAPSDLALALVTADRALGVAPALPEARFNRALAFDGLSLVYQARPAWDDSLQVDARSPWAAEARDRLQALAAPTTSDLWTMEREHLGPIALQGDGEKLREVARRFPQELRLHVEEDLLGSWAEAVRGGRSEEAGQTLSIARTLAHALAGTVGEHLPEDAVAAIDAAAEDPARRAALIEGHAAYREARKLYAQRLGPQAAARFEEARRAFAQGGSPMAGWASLYGAIVVFERFDFAPALDSFLAILRAPGNRRHPLLLGRAHWMSGMASLARGEPAAALEHDLAAFAIFERMGASDDVAGASTLLSEVYRYLGDPRETWRYAHEGLAALRRSGNARRRHAILAETADACLADGKPEAALYFREEAARVALESEEPVAISHALLQRSGAHLRVGNREQAAKDLAEARRFLAEIENDDLAGRVQADLLLAEGELALAAGDPKAEEDLTEALAFHAGKGNHFPLGRLYLARARARLAQGEQAAAEKDLQRGIEEYERQRRWVVEERLQISFFDRSEPLFDEMIRLQAGRPGGAETALDFAERRRARALLDRLGSLFSRTERARLVEDAARSLTAAEIRQALPKGVAIVEYELLEDRLLAWTIRRDGIRLVATEIAPAALRKLTDRFVASVLRAAPAADIAPLSGELHRVLIRPLLPSLRSREAVVFVPDGVLHGVPFAALRNPETGRYLVQDHLVLLAPSATLFIESSRRDRALAARAGRKLLVVGNPALDPKSFGTLPPLPDAGREAAALAALSPDSMLLEGARATKAAFLAEAGGHDFVHFAGHAVLNRGFPLLSHLVFAPEGPHESGALYAHELHGRHFERTRLVVLAACSTAAGPATGEGAMSLARSFLAAGAPAVVASLWPVDDAEAARFFRLFYGRLKEGQAPAIALRNAQLAMLSSAESENRGEWAGFELLGGGTLVSSNSPIV